MSSDRILSIQSHVSFGYVGGKAAVFPLQCLGYDVDVVNTVNFSNHAGYGRFGGSKTTAVELEAIFKSMEDTGLLIPGRLLTGYIPGAESLTAIAKLVQKLKAQKPDLVYLLDPVLGDSGRLYVAPDAIPVYRTLLPLSTVITPNWFEVETLTDIQLKDVDSLQRALRSLHYTYKVRNVVISSIPLKPWLVEALPDPIRPSGDEVEEYLLCLSSSVSSSEDERSTVHAKCVPLIPGYFSGVGDLFSGLLIGHFQPEATTTNDLGSTPLSSAASQALSKTHGVLKLTHAHSCTLPGDEQLPTDEEKDVAEPIRKYKRMRGRELRLVQGQDILRGVAGKGAEERTMLPWASFWG